jgi:protein-tyrosine sulfotransferase
MSNEKSLGRYVDFMATVIGKVSKRARPEHQDRLAAEIAWLNSWSPRAGDKSGYGELSVRHSNTLTLIFQAIESMTVSDQNEIQAEVMNDFRRAAEMIDGLASPGIVLKRMEKCPRRLNSDLCDPIFLVSSWRSGSTLLMSLLGSHKNLVALPENNFLDPFLTVSADGTRNLRPLLYGRNPPIVDACSSTLHLGVSDEVFYEYFATFVDSVVSSYVRERGGRRWIYKEIVNSDSLELIDILFGYRARFIWLVRHGLDVINSEIERYECRNVRCPDLSEYAREWVVRNGLFADFHDRTAKRCIRVRYEDLVVNPDAETRRLLEFLEEPWDEEIFIQMQRSAGVPRGDHKFTLSQGKIDPARTGRWKAWPPAYILQLGQIVNPMLCRAGYDSCLSGKDA